MPHFTGPIATAGHLQTMMAFPGQVLMEFNQGERPGLGVTVDLAQLTAGGEVTTGAPGVTNRRPDGSLTHW